MVLTNLGVGWKLSGCPLQRPRQAGDACPDYSRQEGVAVIRRRRRERESGRARGDAVGGSVDAMQRVLDSLEDHVRGLAGSWASVERSDCYEGAISMVEVQPGNPGSGALLIVGESLLEVGEPWLEVEVGGLGATWLLGYGDADIQRARQIIEAVINGRVTERIYRSRSEVVVTLSTGEELTETGVGTGRSPKGLRQTVAWESYQPPAIRS